MYDESQGSSPDSPRARGYDGPSGLRSVLRNRRATMMIHRIGFFHFVAETAHPIDALKKTLTQSAADVSGALIVLPEAFNIADEYWRPLGPRLRPANTEKAVLFDLQHICKEFGVCFVAGLIMRAPNDPDPPHSSAWLIDSSEFWLLSLKHSNDGTGAGPGGRRDYTSNYTPCSEDCDASNGVCYQNVWIAALLCMDAYPKDLTYGEANSRRHDLLRAKLAECARGGAHAVLCVPSHMQEIVREGIYPYWPGFYVVLANSCVGGPGSFIAKVSEGQPQGTDDSILVSCTYEHCNRLRVIDLPDH